MSPALLPSIYHDVKQDKHAYACSQILTSNVHLAVVVKIMPWMNKPLDIDTNCIKYAAG